MSVSDALPADMIFERISALNDLRSSCPHLNHICVRNDSFDPEMFAAAVSMASAAGFGMVSESSDPVCLRAISQICPDAVLCPTDASILSEASMLSSIFGNPLAVPGVDVQDLMDNAESAASAGVSDIILNPTIMNMKSCLETNTDLSRLASEHDIPLAKNPVMTRSWSGEYAMSIASVSILRHGSIIVLDDLDPEGCRILDALMDSCACGTLSDENRYRLSIPDSSR